MHNRNPVSETFIQQANAAASALVEEDYDHLSRQLARRGVDAETLVERAMAFRVAVPSWGLGSGGTRFARFPIAGEPRNVFEKLEDGEVGTTFNNKVASYRGMFDQKKYGSLTGRLGFEGFHRNYGTVGDEILINGPVKQDSFSVFGLEELTFERVTLQFGGRFDRASYSPGGGLRPREFNNASFSVGSLFRPTERSTIAASFARAARNPALEELYFHGLHSGNFSFEIGNENLDSEVAYGLDVSYRVRLPRMSAEVTYYNNTIDNYIFRSPVSEEEYEARFGEIPQGGHEGHDHGEELPIIEFLGRDARLQGVEAHADVEVTRGLHLELGVDTVRGSLRDTGEPLPRVPPVRFIGGLQYHRNAWQVGTQVVSTLDQDRVYDTETPTAGYTTLRLFGAYSLQAGRLLHTFSARFDNVTNELYRNHLSLVKDLVPEMGRNARVVWSVRF